MTQDGYRNSHCSPRPAGPAACPGPRWTPVMRLARYLFVLSLMGCGGPAMNAPSHEDSSPLTVSSPDLPGGTFPRACSPATAPTGSPAWSGARRQLAPGSWP
jgi:hypothetical protein